MDNFFEVLPLSGREKDQLKELGADSPVSLLAMIEANPVAFENLLGAKKLSDLQNFLEDLLTEQDSYFLKNQSVKHFKLGAVTEKKFPKLTEPDYDINERDRLYEELKNLKSEQSFSDENKERISKITDKLNRMMK